MVINMRVCIIVEGAYPYVTGGVSTWLQQLILNMPEVEFVLQVISAKRDNTREFKYAIPDNVVEIQEIYLLDDDYVDFFTKKKIKMKSADHKSFEDLMFGKNVNWSDIFNFFIKYNVSINAILSGYDFFEIVAAYHEENYPNIPFTDFLWAMRSMYMPLFTILNAATIKADVYHSVSSGYAAILGSMQKTIHGNPFFLTEHGLYSREREEEIIRAEWVEGVYKDLWIDQFNKIGECGYQYADVVSSLFAGARQLQLEMGCSESKAIIIPNGVDIARYENIEMKSPTDEFINIGVIARIARIKDLKTLIVAFSNAKQRDQRLKLWMMGSAEEDLEYAQECEDLIKRLNVSDVIFTGNVNVLDYIGKMDFFLLSSISEGQPLVILEAYAAKKPFIATNVGNCKGLIEGEFDTEGNAGYIVPVTDSSKMAHAILDIASNEEMRKKMGEIGYNRAVKYYDKDDIYNQYYDVYKKLC